MAAQYDLSVMAVARQAGQDRLEQAGVFCTEPPRRPARGRGEDRLILYLALQGNAPLPPARQEQLLAELAKIYYQTPGSVTAALRRVAENLNHILLERNLRLSSAGQQATAMCAQVVMRGEQLFLAQSGAVQAFLITATGVQHFYDPMAAGRVLGQGRTFPLSFAQATLQQHDTLLLAAHPSPAWEPGTLSGLHGQGPETLRRRLFFQPEPDLNALLVQARVGKGKFFVYPRTLSSAPAAAAGQPPKAAPEQAAAVPAAAEGPGAAGGAETQPAVEVAAAAAAEAAASTVTAASAVVEQAPAAAESTPVPARPSREARPRSSGRTGAAFWPQMRTALSRFPNLLAAAGVPILSSLQRVGRGIGRVVVRLIPGEPFVNIPSYVMAAIALGVPIVLVTVASVVYFRLGRAAQYEQLFEQAKQQAVYALGQTEPQAQREAWQALLLTLDQAEQYQKTPETQELRWQARNALDALELVRRIDYQPALIGALPATVTVRRIVVSNRDLYLLDGNSGNVLRAEYTARGYLIDSSFQCGPNQPVVATTSPIVDLVAWPAGLEPKAEVLALDAGGKLLFCRSGATPIDKRPALPHTGSWGNLVAFTLDMNNLFILDPAWNTVWVYWGLSDAAINNSPNMFFDKEVPFMQDVVDLAVNRFDLYLLHADGRLSLCVFGSRGPNDPTLCREPDYLDARPGRENVPLKTIAPFSRMLYAPPPDPSLFMLDPLTHSIYQFSLQKLILQRRFLPQTDLPEFEATAFWVDINKRQAFLAIGNVIYYGMMP